ncbi:ImmA/IrrE family metallo-endopeptidase [Thermicanus aegyptius]|uniref:ImmA/IrrE family metallo-endopeptidase n=1 Tax=Thermicanus aegyptius TaxID=94009 RepID=UPI0003FDEFD9|nr:ImmA/IrrE family metallo-endopeptidase [Thermicanus aegyptius]
MPFPLLQLADKMGIKVHYHDFSPPLEGVYWSHPDYPPIIGLSRSLLSDRARYRCVLAEEIGHHFTTPIFATLPKAYFHYRDRLEISRAEYRALKWAANYLIPLDKLCEAQKNGIVDLWDLAEHFDVTEEMMRFRMNLADVRGRLKLMEKMSV